jgi:acyl-CoA synthetase (NDP forming)
MDLKTEAAPGIDAHPLTSMFRARSVVLIGASDRNALSRFAAWNLQNFGFEGKVFAVNPRGGEAHGYPCLTSCAEIGEPVDAAFVAAPRAAVMGAMADAVAAGIRNFVMLSAGFAETGPEGAALQDELVAYVRENGLRMLGPNCLGFMNYLDGVSLAAMRGALPKITGSIGLVTASGSNGMMAQNYAHQQGVGFSYIVSTGNEADLDIAEVVDFLVDDAATRCIAIYAETIRHPGRFAAAARRALEARKPVVILKAGSADVAAALAASHTGALVGDDKVFDAVCRAYGLVRVRSIEQLVTTAHLMSRIGPVSRRGVALVSVSGGACGICADLAALAGVELPAFAPQTVEALSAVVSTLGATHNPIDITGAAMQDPSLWEKVPTIVGRDPQIGLTICNVEIPNEPNPYFEGTLASLAKVFAAGGGAPGLVMTSFPKTFNAHGQAVLAQVGDPLVLQGMSFTLEAVAGLMAWSKRLEQPAPEVVGVLAMPADPPRDERQALAHLGRFGVGTITAEVVADEAAAAAAAARIGGPVVLKVVSPDIAHKTEVGGVALDLKTPDEVGEAYRRMVARLAAAAPKARIEGIAVSPMRREGLEFLVGVTRDPDWGLVLAVGLGGVWTEALNDMALFLLPSTLAEVEAGLRGLRAAKLFEGYRGAAGADVAAVARAAVAIGQAALALGPDLETFEVNPLRVAGAEVEALDALAVWRRAAGQ